jgi:hypothetical protein
MSYQEYGEKFDEARRYKVLQMVMDTDTLKLPAEVVDKLGTSQVMLREVPEGVLLLPMKAKPLYGLLKDTDMSLDKFMELKHADKNLEQ